MSHLSNVWTRATELQIASGSGSYITTVDGVEYLDFTAGVGTLNLGYSHPAVTAAIAAQAQRFVHAHPNTLGHDLLEPLAQRMNDITPDGIERFFFALSGDDVTEAAVKMAKQVTKRPNVIVFDGGFHGRTHLGMAMSTVRNRYRFGHQPLPAGIYVAPFPDPVADDRSEAIVVALNGLDRLLVTQSAPRETAAMIIEPVLGEGGCIPAPRPFLEGIAQRCQEHDILLIVDEVTTGFGRTGTWFASERFNIQPDAMLMSKGFASGLPMAALGLRAELDDRWPPGSHSGTYGGSALGSAAALATIDQMSEPGFFDAVSDRGDQLKDALSSMKEIDPTIRQVRGPGLMLAVYFEDPQRVPAVLTHCLDHGRLVLMPSGGPDGVIRWMPPLTVTEREVRQAARAFEAALRATQGS